MTNVTGRLAAGSPAVIAILAVLLVSLASPGAAHGLEPGQLVIADSQAFGGAGGLVSVDPSTGAETGLSYNAQAVNASTQFMGGPYTVVFDSSGDMIVGETDGLGGSCSGGCGGVVEVDPSTGKQTLVSSNAMSVNSASQYFGQVNGVAVDSAGDIIVSDWGACVGCGKIISVNPSTGQETLISSNAMPVNASSQLFAYPQGLTIAPDGTIYVADSLAFGGVGHGGGIIAVNPSTGKQSEVSANSQPVNAGTQYFTGLGDLTVDSSGQILAADWGGGGGTPGKIVAVDPSTGKESIFASNSMTVNAARQYFSEPVGITIASDGSIYVADEGAFGPCAPGCGGVIEVNPSTREETAISSNLLTINASDQLFTDPWAVAVVPGARGGPGGKKGSGLHVTYLRARIHQRRRRASFAFGAAGGQGRTMFMCRLDRHRARRCRSPKRYRHIRAGQHVFAVQAVSGGQRSAWRRCRFTMRRH